jgi:glutaconate CoA-transferase subunit A
MAANPALKLVRSPYPAGFDALGADRGADRGADDEPGELLAAVPALKLDAALLHMNRADRAGNAAFLGPDLYFDDLFAAAADATYLSTTRLVDNAALGDAGPTRMRIHRMWIQGVVESPLGAHFTDCEPDHRRDETFQQLYAATAKSAAAWEDFRARFIDLPDEAAYREAVARWRAS